MFTELWWFLNCRKRPHENSVSQVTAGDIQPAPTNSQRTATRSSPSSQQRGRWFVAGGGIFENLLKTQVYVNSRQFHEVKSNLCFTSIKNYARLLFRSIHFQ